MTKKKIKKDMYDIEELATVATNLPKIPKINDEDIEEEGKKEYDFICDYFGIRIGELVYHRGVKSFPVSGSKYSFVLGDNSYDKSAIISILKEKDKYDKLMRYLLKYYNMRNKPVLHKYSFLLNATASNAKGYKYRSDLEPYKNDFDKLTAMASTLKIALDIETSTYNVYVPMIRRIKADNKMIDKYLEITFGEYKDVIKSYLAVFTFENRYGISRPTLLLQGERGLGKSTFIESIMAQIYPGSSAAVTTLNTGFNAWRDNKLAYIGDMSYENHTGADMWDLAKEISGDGTTPINQKHQRSTQVDNGLYFVISTNSTKPLHVKDVPASENQNQWLHIKLEETPEKAEAIRLFELEITGKEYNGFKDFFADHLGHYIYTELFEHYKKLRKSIIKNPCRYGMPVPITQAFKELIQLSASGNDSNIIGIVKDLYYGNYDGYGFVDNAEIDVFKMFSNGLLSNPDLVGFVPYDILFRMIDKKRIKGSYFTNYMSKMKWLVDNGVATSVFDPCAGGFNHNKVYSGMILDFEKIESYIIKEEAVSAEKIEAIAMKSVKGNPTKAVSLKIAEPEPKKKAKLEKIDIDTLL